MNISKITLADVLLARESRANKQAELLSDFKLPLVSLSMNIPGEVKRTPLIQFVYKIALKRLKKELGEPIQMHETLAVTGCEALLVYDVSPEKLKQTAMIIEENALAGRLYDIDVIDINGEKLARNTQRSCFVCGEKGAGCARSRAHTLAELQLAVEKMLVAEAAQELGDIAYEALLKEVSATPKPGLVDEADSGAHKDMDLSLFIKSANAIYPFFVQMAEESLINAAPMEKLREIGMAAEKAMMRATNGVNTHRGAIFALGLLVYGAAKSLMHGGCITSNAAKLVLNEMQASEASLWQGKTNGVKLYNALGLTGARGEAVQGFPCAVAVYKELSRLINKGVDERTALALALPVSMASLMDTNLVHRGGMEGLLFAQNAARDVLAMKDENKASALAALNTAFVEKNLSPGGSADALALAAFMYGFEKMK